MKLTYQTATGTLIQFVVLTFLNIGDQINSAVTACRHDGDCANNIFLSVALYVLTAGFFGAVWLLGYFAQVNRSKRLAQLLICSEAFIALIAAFNAKHHTDALSLFTSLVDLVLALWIVTLAFRLMRVSGAGIFNNGQRPRQRVRKPVK